MRELLQCGQWDRAGEWLTEAYHQHNPNAASGLDGVVEFFTKVMKVSAWTCDKLTTEVVAVMADGDYVTVMMPRKFPDPRTPARSTSRRGSTPGGSWTARPTSTGIRPRFTAAGKVVWRIDAALSSQVAAAPGPVGPGGRLTR